LDTPQARTYGGRERDIGVYVRCCDPIFDALRCCRTADYTQRAGAVFIAPVRLGRRPEVRHQPRVAVDSTRHHGEQLGHELLLAADEPAHRLRQAVLSLLAEEGG